jgi:hypothetical protein
MKIQVKVCSLMTTTPAKFIAGVFDTGEQLIASVVDIGD